jgi:uncharacterized protein
MSGGDWKEMFNAAVQGDLALVALHVESGVDVNYAHPEFLSTPLVAAILARQGAVAHYLLAHGASPTLGSEFDGTDPLGAARQAGLADVAERLIGMGAKPAAATALPGESAGAQPAGWWRKLRRGWRQA